MSALRLSLFNPAAEAAPAASPPPDRSPGKTVRQVLDWFRRSKQSQDIDAKALKERLRLWSLFEAEFGDERVADMKRYQLLGWIDQHAGDLADHTRKRWAATIQVAFNKAAELDFVPFNPFLGLKMPRGKKGRDWSIDEYRRVLRSTHNLSFRRFLLGIRLSGMRPGEVAMLQWPHVKEADLKIVFGAHEHKTGKKTGEVRALPTNQKFRNLLAWLRAHNPAGTTHVFLNSKGTRWKTRAWTKDMADARERAGLPKEVKCHGGRHTWVTQAQINGVGLATVSAIAGHKTINTTADGYTHVGGKVDHLAEAAEQAVTAKPKKRPAAKPAEQTPLFDGAE